MLMWQWQYYFQISGAIDLHSTTIFDGKSFRGYL